VDRILAESFWRPSARPASPAANVVLLSFPGLRRPAERAPRP
jgi:hypothetical protein